jgi:hypothetical protein
MFDPAKYNKTPGPERRKPSRVLVWFAGSLGLIGSAVTFGILNDDPSTCGVSETTSITVVGPARLDDLASVPAAVDNPTLLEISVVEVHTRNDTGLEHKLASAAPNEVNSVNVASAFECS